MGKRVFFFQTKADRIQVSSYSDSMIFRRFYQGLGRYPLMQIPQKGYNFEDL